MDNPTGEEGGKTGLDRFLASPRRWLVTGVAGFIGSHLLEALLNAGQDVTGMDDFSTGRQSNLDEVRDAVGPAPWARFSLIRGDIRDLATCRQATAGVDTVLHQAALASVPLSIADPLAAMAINVEGFMNILVAGRDDGVRRVVYASSSAVYGDEPGQAKREDHLGRPLSPYALTKRVDEQVADLFCHLYGMETIGLRYFNVFGRRQDPAGPYAAVIPIWAAALVRGEACRIHGDGGQTRDFLHVADVVRANLLAAAADSAAVCNVYNVAGGSSVTLTELEATLRGLLGGTAAPTYGPPRPGDIVHSLADPTRAEELLGFRASLSLRAGLEEALAYYRASPGV